MQRSARPFGLALLVQGLGNRQRIRIRFNHAADFRPMRIDGVNARQIFLRDRPRRVFPGLHPLLQLGNRHFVEFECLHLIAPTRREGIPAQAGICTGPISEFGPCVVAHFDSRSRERRRKRRRGPRHRAHPQKFPPSGHLCFVFEFRFFRQAGFLILVSGDCIIPQLGTR